MLNISFKMNENLPHPTEERNFGFWNRCHMEPVDAPYIVVLFNFNRRNI